MLVCWPRGLAPAQSEEGRDNSSFRELPRPDVHFLQDCRRFPARQGDQRCRLAQEFHLCLAVHSAQEGLLRRAGQRARGILWHQAFPI